MSHTVPARPPADPAPGRRRHWPRYALAAGAVLGVVAWVAQAPRAARIPHFAANTPSVIAHAGAQGHAPPNTLEAFALALELGADTLEMDAQLTADGEVVVIHDGTVDATTDGTGAVAAMTLAELKGLDAGFAFEDAGGDHPYRGRGVEIPTLGEVFAAFPDTFMVVELKTEGGPAIVEAVAGVIERHDRAGRVAVASFDVSYLRRFREVAPGVATSMAEDEIRTFYVLHRAGLHRWWRPPGQLFEVPEYHDETHVVTPSFVRAAERLGVDVHVWTVNDAAEAERLLDAGVHGIITDYPGRMRELTERR